jgi:hypothetical protein
VLVSGVGVVVEFEPGTAPGVVDAVGGAVVVLVGGGVVVLVGGAVGVLVGGFAVLGVWACPARTALPDGAAPVCATTQVAKQKIIERRVIFLMAISKNSQS